MFSHTKPLSALRIPLTFAALSILLAACGGGNDDGTPAVSASPRASTAGSTSTSGATSSSTATAAAGASTTLAANGASNTGNAGAPATGNPNQTAAGNADTTGGSAAGNGSSASNTNSATPGSNAGSGNASPAGQPDANASANAPANGTGASSANPAPRGDDTASANPAAQGTPPSGTAPAISDTGVRGDVVRAMIEQRRCWTETIRATDFNGAEIDHQNPARDTVPVMMSAIMSGTRYQWDESWRLRISSLVPGEAARCAEESKWTYIGPAEPGVHSYTVQLYPRYSEPRLYYYGMDYIKRGVNASQITYQLTVGQDRVEFSPALQIKQREDMGHHAQDHASVPAEDTFEAVYQAEKPLTIEHGATFGFGMLNQWLYTPGPVAPRPDANGWDGQGGMAQYNVQLMLIKGDAPNEVKLCTHENNNLVKRLHCTVWQVPENWTTGQALSFVDEYAVDDRSVWPNETGFYFWRAMPRR